jgi:hypothetical protein
MAWDLEFEDAFGQWWEQLTSDEQEAVDFMVQLLAMHGPSIGAAVEPESAETLRTPTREVRAWHLSRTYRILYTIQPGRSTVVLLKGVTLDTWRCLPGTPSVQAATAPAYGH